MGGCLPYSGQGQTEFFMRYVTTTRNTQGRMSEVCPYQRPGSSDILLLSSQIYKKGCKAWESGSQKGRTTFP